MSGAFNYVYYGKADDVAVFSGIPWHICDAAGRLGILGRTFGIDIPALRWVRAAYSLKQLARLDKPTGFQWSREHAAACTRRLKSQGVFDLPVLGSQTPVLDPAGIPSGASVYWYLDATIAQLAEHYGLRKRVSPATLARIEDHFRANLHRAGCTFAHSRWAGMSLVRDYGLPEDRAVVVPPGCNISCALLDESDDIIRRQRETLDREYDFVVNFCGMDWRRKGLDVLLEAWKQLVQDNKGRFLLRVMGPIPEELGADWPSVEFTGRFDKRNDARTYITRLACAHLFCLPTRSDASPQVVLESIRMGTPVLCSRIGGIPESVKEGVNGLLLGPKVEVEDLLAALTDLLRNKDKLMALREGVDRTRHEYDWQRAVRVIAGHMGVAVG